MLFHRKVISLYDILLVEIFDLVLKSDLYDLLGGISKKGLTPLVLFKGIMRSPDFQHYMSLSVMPFIREKFPFQHRLFMDNDPKHTSGSTKEFLFSNGINHVETPAQSPVSTLKF
jgi:hypothetical protein